jgi:hypothetical protein
VLVVVGVFLSAALCEGEGIQRLKDTSGKCVVSVEDDESLRERKVFNQSDGSEHSLTYLILPTKLQLAST